MGFAVKFSRADTSTHEIAAVGGWNSADMVNRSTRKETAKRGAGARYVEERQDSTG